MSAMLEGQHVADPPIVEGRLARALRQLLVEAGTLIDRDREAARACIDRAAALLEGQGGHRSPAEPASIGNGRGLAPWQARRAAAYVDENLGSTIRLHDLAASARLTVSYFSSAFKGSFGIPPRTYILKRRVDLAHELMLTTDEPLSQIALACGFSDQAHFCRVFHKEFGMAPSIWRRDRRGCIAPG